MSAESPTLPEVFTVDEIARVADVSAADVANALEADGIATRARPIRAVHRRDPRGGDAAGGTAGMDQPTSPVRPPPACQITDRCPAGRLRGAPCRRAGGDGADCQPRRAERADGAARAGNRTSRIPHDSRPGWRWRRRRTERSAAGPARRPSKAEASCAARSASVAKRARAPDDACGDSTASRGARAGAGAGSPSTGSGSDTSGRRAGRERPVRHRGSRRRRDGPGGDRAEPRQRDWRRHRDRTGDGQRSGDRRRHRPRFDRGHRRRTVSTGRRHHAADRSSGGQAGLQRRRPSPRRRRRGGDGSRRPLRRHVGAVRVVKGSAPGSIPGDRRREAVEVLAGAAIRHAGGRARGNRGRVQAAVARGQWSWMPFC